MVHILFTFIAPYIILEVSCLRFVAAIIRTHQIDPTPELVNSLSSARSYSDVDEPQPTLDADEQAAFEASSLEVSARCGFATCASARDTYFHTLNHGGWQVQNYTEPPYSWRCPWMKARYNNQDDERDPPMWKFAWSWGGRTLEEWLAKEDDGSCASLPNAMTGVHRSLSRGKQLAPVRIMFMGNSYVRQIFEAINCKWHSEISQAIMRTSGPAMNIEELEAETIYSRADVTVEPISSSLRSDPSFGCHGNVKDDEEAKWLYPEEEPVGVVENTCDDSIAMTAFGQQSCSLEFHYIMRPYSYDPKNDDSLRLIIEHDLMRNKSIDNGFQALIYNKDATKYGAIQEISKWPLFRDAVILDIHSLLAMFRENMKKSYDPVFTNGNHGGREDVHPTMPGIPDQEALLLLLALAREGHAGDSAL